MKYAVQNCMTEWSFSSGKPYGDPFGEVEVDVVFTEPGGEEKRMPAFWAGGQTWKVRYATPVVGTHRYRTECCDTGNADLHGQEGEGEVAPYEGDNPLLKHGPLRVSADQRHFEHIDGTPFLWLGDTWWMGLCKRLRWPGDFQLLVADRVAKGFSVIQIVAGPYPDMGPFDPRGVNEAGHSWTEGFDCVNPAYFDMADMRMNHLVESGLVPCILGCWGYYIDFAGVEVMKKHWRYLLARYGAYPVVWCMAGEATMLCRRVATKTRRPRPRRRRARIGRRLRATSVRSIRIITWSRSIPASRPAIRWTTSLCSISTCSRQAMAAATVCQTR